jgi:hypothetical protein
MNVYHVCLVEDGDRREGGMLIDKAGEGTLGSVRTMRVKVKHWPFSQRALGNH